MAAAVSSSAGSCLVRPGLVTSTQATTPAPLVTGPLSSLTPPAPPQTLLSVGQRASLAVPSTPAMVMTTSESASELADSTSSLAAVHRRPVASSSDSESLVAAPPEAPMEEQSPAVVALAADAVATGITASDGPSEATTPVAATPPAPVPLPVMERSRAPNDTRLPPPQAFSAAAPETPHSRARCCGSDKSDTDKVVVDVVGVCESPSPEEVPLWRPMTRKSNMPSVEEVAPPAARVPSPMTAPTPMVKGVVAGDESPVEAIAAAVAASLAAEDLVPTVVINLPSPLSSASPAAQFHGDTSVGADGNCSLRASEGCGDGLETAELPEAVDYGSVDPSGASLSSMSPPTAEAEFPARFGLDEEMGWTPSFHSLSPIEMPPPLMGSPNHSPTTPPSLGATPTESAFHNEARLPSQTLAGAITGDTVAVLDCATPPRTPGGAQDEGHEGDNVFKSAETLQSASRQLIANEREVAELTSAVGAKAAERRRMEAVVNRNSERLAEGEATVKKLTAELEDAKVQRDSMRKQLKEKGEKQNELVRKLRQHSDANREMEADIAKAWAAKQKLESQAKQEHAARAQAMLQTKEMMQKVHDLENEVAAVDASRSQMDSSALFSGKLEAQLDNLSKKLEETVRAVQTRRELPPAVMGAALAVAARVAATVKSVGESDTSAVSPSARGSDSLPAPSTAASSSAVASTKVASGRDGGIGRRAASPRRQSGPGGVDVCAAGDGAAAAVAAAASAGTATSTRRRHSSRGNARSLSPRAQHRRKSGLGSSPGSPPPQVSGDPRSCVPATTREVAVMPGIPSSREASAEVTEEELPTAQEQLVGEWSSVSLTGLRYDSHDRLPFCESERDNGSSSRCSFLTGNTDGGPGSYVVAVQDDRRTSLASIGSMGSPISSSRPDVDAGDTSVSDTSAPAPVSPAASGSLTLRDLSEIKALKKPPPPIRMLMEVCCLLFNIIPVRQPDDRCAKRWRLDYWEPARRYLLSDPFFLSKLRSYDEEIPPGQRVKIRRYFQDPEFTADRVKTCSKAAYELYGWVALLLQRSPSSAVPNTSPRVNSKESPVPSARLPKPAA
eukprot:TRINITY_DN62224_c0_g1_i1.p1 TRINITY_DN62224_c0_g1~~TRINITY_DN62224_c0_g1_i1.p1  ORF type:complete len:1226 (-),score=253.10 TRINITY_DN62224_c0_g1_i1:61-3279(-)